MKPTVDPPADATSGLPGRSVRLLVLILAGVLLVAPVPMPIELAGAQTMLLAPKSLARVIHASPDTPALDVYLDQIPIVSDTTFGDASRYLPLDAGEHVVSIVPAGGDLIRQSLAETTVTLEPNQFVVIMVQGYLSGISVASTTVDTAPQEDVGYARLRLINAVPDVPAGDLLLPDGQVVFDDAIPLTTSSYDAFQAGQHELIFRPIRPEDVGDVPISVALLPDVSYDLVLIGDARTRSIRPLAFPTANEQSCAQFLGIGPAGRGCLTVVHASRNLGPIDVYVGDEPQPVATGLTFGTAGQPIPIPPASVDYRIVASGAPPDDDLLTDAVLAEDGESLLLVVNGPADRLSVELYEDDRSPLGGTQSRIQVIHETDGAGTIDVALNGTPLVGALLEGETSEPRLVSEDVYRIAVTSNDDGQVLVTSDEIVLQAGVSHRAVIMGDLEQGVVIVVVIAAPVPTDRNIPAA